MISVITPWLNHSELCAVYEKSVSAAGEVIVVDNGSDWHHARRIEQMVSRLGGVLIRNEYNNQFAPANNQGLAVARGQVVVFLNNDCEFRGDWATVEGETGPGVIAGPSMLTKHGASYIEGHCIAARRDVWLDLGGWPEDLPGMYWEDNILCLEAVRKGYQLKQTNWPVWHYGNYTSAQTPGAYAASSANQAEFLRRLYAR